MTDTAMQTTEPTTEAVLGVVTDGAHSLIVAQFADTTQAEAAYEALREIEQQTSLQIDGVIVASCDAEGKIHLGKVTEHSTRTGLKWGVIGGAVVGLIFPPSILAGAAGFGAMGAAMGKIGNIFARSELATELAEVMTPNTSGIVAVVADTAVLEVEKALDKADKIVAKAIDKQVAAEIDRAEKQAKAEAAS